MSQLLAPLGGHPGGSMGKQPRVFEGFCRGFFGTQKSVVLVEKNSLEKKNGDSLELS